MNPVVETTEVQNRPSKARKRQSGPLPRRKTVKRSNRPSRASQGHSPVRHLPLFGLSIIPERLWAKIEVHPEWGCWEYTKQKATYKHVMVSGESMLMHRFFFLKFRGWLPEGGQKREREIDHYRYPESCVGPACMHPHHMKVVPTKDNVLRSSNPFATFARATHCKNGHEWDEANTRWRISSVTKRPARACRTCNILNQRKYRERRAKGVSR